MKPSAWPAALAAMLAGLILIPAAALGAPPERVLVCHLIPDSAPDGHQWILVEVSIKSLDKHRAHGDGIPGQEIPGSNGASVFDEDCTHLPEPLPDPEPSPPPQPSELVFAVAYSDTDGNDGGYNPAVDVLIAKLIDGPDAANDGRPGAGDLIITHRYPMDFAPTAYGEFLVTEHTVTGLNVGRSYACNMQSGDNAFVWSSGQGDFDLYHEFASATPKAKVIDGIAEPSDTIHVPASSPSQPIQEVALLSDADPTDQTFIDVEANCAIDGS